MIEPQQDGHLHLHIMLYSSVLSPELLEKTAAASSMALQTQISKMLDSITCTTVPCGVHQSYNYLLSSVEYHSKSPQGADIKVPNASSNFDDFISIEMKKSLPTGMHGHGFCCKKGGKGKFMCHLVFKQSFHTWNTCTLLIILSRLEKIAKKQHADVRAYPVYEDTIAMLNAPNNALNGKFIHQHPMGPIIWEQTGYEQDAYNCENNIITTNIVGCANNSSPITSTTSREAAEEYLSEYMVKEKASLKQAVPSLLAASDQILVHPSKAKDTGSII